MKESPVELTKELRTQPVERARLYNFSNIERDEAEAVADVWPELPAETRRDVIATLVEIAERDFAVHFGAIFRIAMHDPDPIVRQMGIEGLWEEKDVRLIPLLAERLQEDPAIEVRAAAATALGRFMLMGELGKLRPRPNEQVYQALLEACRPDGEPVEVWRRALESIAYSGREEVPGLINTAYAHPDERMRLSAIFSMGRSADERWSPPVLAELYSVNPAMRYEAARACGELALKQSRAALIELVEDVDPEVQEAAIWALGQVGGEEARRVLEECLESGNEAVRDAARSALRELEFLHGDLGAFLFPFDEEGEEEEDIP
jgi:HEAT repeat protein